MGEEEAVMQRIEQRRELVDCSCERSMAGAGVAVTNASGSGHLVNKYISSLNYFRQGYFVLH